MILPELQHEVQRVAMTLRGRAATNGQMPAAEMQQEIQRVATNFIERVAQVGEPLAEIGVGAPRREGLLRRVLLYLSSMLDIATGPYPEVNTLDIVVFMHLCRRALERHWIPSGFGASGEALASAFAQSEAEAWELAAKVLEEAKLAHLRELIADWERDHPTQFRVEGLRFREFAEYAGNIANEQSVKARGLLGQMKTATQAADQALLISERAFFLLHRLPFLLRLQIRIAVQESLSDSLSRLEDIEPVIRQLSTVRPLLGDLAVLATGTTETTREARLLVAALEPHVHALAERRSSAAGRQAGAAPEHDRTLGGLLTSSSQLVTQLTTLVRETRGSLPADLSKTVDAVDQRLDRTIRRWGLYLVVLGLAWAGFFWVGSFLVKRLGS